MDKLYVVERVKSDLRNEIYELMTHVGYHDFEKELTEALVNAHPVYNALRLYSRESTIPAETREEVRQLFAYSIFKEMNSQLGGFHFDRYKSFTTGDAQNQKLIDILDALSFTDYLDNLGQFWELRSEPEYADFVISRQYRNLEDAITLAIKKGKVVPAVARAIAQDVVDDLHLTEEFTYLKVTDEARVQVFEFPEEEVGAFISLMKMPVTVNGERCSVMVKRVTRTAAAFMYLQTNFGALIKGL